MLEEYDIDKLNPRPNPYAKELNKQVTVKIAPSVIEFFKDEAMEIGIPYGAEKADIGKEVAEAIRWKEKGDHQKTEQGVSAPPNYLVSLISRVMKADGYIKNELTPEEIDAVRQMQATLSIEGLSLTESEVMDIAGMIRGEISREAYQQRLKENYHRYGKR